MRIFSHPDRRASSLLLVLWALMLLSAAVFGFAKWMQQDLQLHAEANRDLEARAMAHSGIALALHEKVTKLTPGLSEELGGQLGFQVRIQSEGGKLNIRELISGEDAFKLDILKKWLERRGLEYHQREVFVDCLLDWCDADNAHHLNGVEDEGDYHPPNRMLQSIEEIADVRGSEPLTRTEGWKDELTLYSSGRIDLSAAGADVLRLLPIPEANIQRFIQIRQGRDGIDGTIDDLEFKDVNMALSYLGIARGQNKALEALLTVNEQVVHITSEGRSGNVYRQVDVVALKSGAKPNIFSWKE